MVESNNNGDPVDAARDLQESLDALSSTIRNEGRTRRNHFFVVYVAIAIAIVGVVFGIIGNTTAHNAITQNKKNSMCVNKVFEDFVQENSDREQYVNEVAQKSLDLWEAQSKFLTAITNPKETQPESLQAFNVYLKALNSFTTAQNKQIKARNQHPLPTQKDIKSCFQGE